MKVIDSLDALELEPFSQGSAIAIGKFDGVHRGHRELLRRVAEAAVECEVAPAVFTFANNPLSFLRPELCPPSLMSKAQRIDALEHEGVTTCVILPFDAELANLTAERFVAELLVERMAAKFLCVGADFRFGRGGDGDVALLQRLAPELGFIVEVIADVQDEGFGRVSSSRIREAILGGDVEAAGRMLGRPASVRGEVVRGDARGREIGFATANLSPNYEGLRPADGVYAGWAMVGAERHKAAISVGANITFDPNGEARIEAHLLDFAGDSTLR